MALEKEKLEVGDKAQVGLFDGKIVRVIAWQGVVMYDVEIDGVIDRYHEDHVQKI